MPLIARIPREKAGPAVMELLNGPNRLPDVLRTADRGPMPMPARMAIKEEMFNAAVLSHKESLMPPRGPRLITN